jgi:hypothetical protein
VSAVFRHSITRLRSSTVVDRRDNVVVDGPPVPVELFGWAIDAGDTRDPSGEGRDGDVIEYTLRGPFAADVLSSDRLVVLGLECTIVGAVLRQPGVSPATSHTIVGVRRVEG